jgi:hypothetical protein
VLIVDFEIVHPLVYFVPFVVFEETQEVIHRRRVHS